MSSSRQTLITNLSDNHGMETPAEELLLPPQVALLLGVTTVTASQYMKRGDIPAVRVGCHWIAKKSDVLAFVRPRRGPKPKRRSVETTDAIPS